MASKRDQWVIIGISGVTCGGKTTLSNRLRQSMAPTYIFHQDHYFFPDNSPNHVRCRNLDHNNYDILTALDMPKMYDDILKTIDGDDKSHERQLEIESKDTFSIPGKKFLIIDGFIAINYKPILEICHLKYYFILEYGVCMARRVMRVYDPPDIPGYFEECVWPEHVKHRAEIEKEPSVVLLDGTSPDIFEKVMNDIKTFKT